MVLDSSAYRLLVVEDNPGDFVLVEDFLRERMMAPDIVHVESFREAAALLADGQASFDVVLLDLSLNDRTGEPLINDMVRLCPSTPVIVLTGYADFAFGVRSLSMGIADYILKEELTDLVLYKSIVYSMERRRITSALQDSEQRYSDLFHLSPIPMWVYDAETLQFLDVNSAAIEHYGYDVEEFRSMTIRDIRPPSEFAHMQAAIDTLREERPHRSRGIFIHRRKNGSTMQVETQSSTLLYNGRPARLVLATDVTDRLRYVNAIESQNTALRKIAWMQSHVVRAPLARMMMLVSLLRDLDCSKDEAKEAMHHLLASAHELDTIIHDISDLTHTSGVDIGPTAP